MRRRLWLLLAMLVLVSCGADEGLQTPPPAPTALPASPTPTPLPPDATTSARIRARGYLVVGIRYDLQPFGYITDRGEVAGFCVDLGRELARRWLGGAQAVQFRQVRSDTAIERLQAGSVDVVIAPFPHTQSLEAGADFGLPLFVDGQALLVRAADVATIASPASLDGRRVGVVAWDEAASALQGAVPFTVTFEAYDRFDSAVAALGRGDVDAVANLRQRLFWGARMLPGAAVVGQYTAVPVAPAFPQNDPYFADLVNLTFQDMVADGTFAALYARWFAPEVLPTIERWPGDASTPSLADAPAATKAPSTISAIEARGRLVVAVAADRPPFAYVDSTGTLAGYEVNLVRLLAEKWLGDPTAVDFIPSTVEIGTEMVQTGQADMVVGGLSHTRGAELELDFSQTTYVAGDGLLVQTGASITGLASLQGQQVAVIGGAAGQGVLLAGAQASGIALVVVPQPSVESALGLLMAGQVVAIAGDRVDLLRLAYSTPGFSVLPLRLTQVPLALGLPPGDSEFRDLVNMTLLAMKVEGQFDALYGVWFDDAPPPLEIWPGSPYRTLRLTIAAGRPAGG